MWPIVNYNSSELHRVADGSDVSSVKRPQIGKKAPLILNLARWNVAPYAQGGASPQRPHDVVALVGIRLVGPNLPRG